MFNLNKKNEILTTESVTEPSEITFPKNKKG